MSGGSGPSMMYGRVLRACGVVAAIALAVGCGGTSSGGHGTGGGAAASAGIEQPYPGPFIYLTVVSVVMR